MLETSFNWVFFMFFLGPIAVIGLVARLKLVAMFWGEDEL